MKRISAILGVAAWMMVAAAAQDKPGKTLDIYFLDTEGGLAALYISPSGESLLMDTGNPGGRDADRIMEAVRTAGVKQIDHLITTHYHVDHVGGLSELLKRIPVSHFIDHGESGEHTANADNTFRTYTGLVGTAKRTVVKPGDKIPFAGLTVDVVISATQVIKSPMKGAPGAGKPNSTCAAFKPRDESRVDPDNRYSVGVVIGYGKFRTINLGDFTYNAEQELMCPNNPIGSVDLYLTSHHGIDQSGSAALVHGLQPRVAMMHNSTRKGGAVPTMQVLHSSPGLEDIWQLHWAYAAGMELNAPSLFIANLEDNETMANVLLNPPPTFGQQAPAGRGAAVPPQGGPPAPGQAKAGGPAPGGRGAGHTGPAYFIKVSAQADGAFTVTNMRNNFSKTYAAKK
jgi:competence protein ComEC